MAHADDIKKAVRAAFIFDGIPLERAAPMHGVAHSTAARWKRLAKEGGDDWDKARAASLFAGDGMEATARQMLAEYLTQHAALMDEIKNSAETRAADKVAMLSSLADSFTKTVAACRRALPETDEFAVALEVVRLLGEYVKKQFPQHAPAFLEIIDPFGEELSRHFSKKK